MRARISVRLYADAKDSLSLARLDREARGALGAKTRLAPPRSLVVEASCWAEDLNRLVSGLAQLLSSKHLDAACLEYSLLLRGCPCGSAAKASAAVSCVLELPGAKAFVVCKGDSAVARFAATGALLERQSPPPSAFLKCGSGQELIEYLASVKERVAKALEALSESEAGNI